MAFTRYLSSYTSTRDSEVRYEQMGLGWCPQRTAVAELRSKQPITY